MWLKRLVAVSMIITLVGLNAIVLIGVFSPSERSFSLSQQALPPTPPVITISANPTEVATGLFSAISWEVTGEITSCTASGDWSGPKTQFGSESTGRISAEGKKTYTLTCKNDGGSDTKSVSINVTKSAVATIPTSSSSSSGNSSSSGSSSAAQPVYCGGATPCYGPKDVAGHSGAGNCWGWNGNRVINISSFDAAYHKGKTGISSIEVSGVCGKDLGPSLGGGVSAGGQTRDHNSSTKANADRNMIPYFVGYFDSSKP
ncbi:hypothetical protein KDA14_02950 [Candidatus Saccharibacteria bacterium]|nr:hypothetical protein [Candidatus Saccharibacteria bacterium]